LQAAGDKSGTGESVLVGINIGAPQQGCFDGDQDADPGPASLAAGLRSRLRSFAVKSLAASAMNSFFVHANGGVSQEDSRGIPTAVKE
jgi:hypothetical protein